MREAKLAERKRKGKEVESEKRQRKEEGGTSREKAGGSNEEGGKGVMMTETKCTLETAINGEMREIALIERQNAISESSAEVVRLHKWGGRLLANLQARPPSRPEVEPKRWQGGPVCQALPVDLTSVRLDPMQLKEGAHLVEFYAGGVCGGLVAVLASGAVVRKNTYVDHDAVATATTTAFVAKLALRFPAQLSRSAIQGFNKRCP